ncbi:uncharacterized protein LOC131148900 isoform X2 [Malania oleifera]|uniref:uncharacterized protein LOC131148900 isoform X2 n=1 Tax=Malania oleifera TaxID=397392 RepID=UPI0025AE7172|nr:uncharacterized protein LOC131148900 isoform X2 [Malania oleifera]
MASLCLYASAVPRKACEALHSIRTRSGYRVITSILLSSNLHRRSNHFTRRHYAAAELRSPDLVALEYADLNLNHKISEEVGHIRIRQHVNPLSASLSVPVQVPDWNKVFRNATLPLTVDIGSGSGRFLIWLAKRNPNLGNYLGLEIRQKLVKRAKFWVKELALGNIHFMFANAMVSFEELVSTYPGPLKMVLILVFVQSDVLEMALDMRNQFDAKSDALQHMETINPSVPCDAEGWLLMNPMGIRTEREIHAEFEGAKIYRRMYQKRI